MDVLFWFVVAFLILVLVAEVVYFVFLKKYVIDKFSSHEDEDNESAEGDAHES